MPNSRMPGTVGNRSSQPEDLLIRSEEFGLLDAYPTLEKQNRHHGHLRTQTRTVGRTSTSTEAGVGRREGADTSRTSNEAYEQSVVLYESKKPISTNSGTYKVQISLALKLASTTPSEDALAKVHKFKKGFKEYSVAYETTFSKRFKFVFEHGATKTDQAGARLEALEGALDGLSDIQKKNVMKGYNKIGREQTSDMSKLFPHLCFGASINSGDLGMWILEALELENSLKSMGIRKLASVGVAVKLETSALPCVIQPAFSCQVDVAQLLGQDIPFKVSGSLKIKVSFMPSWKQFVQICGAASAKYRVILLSWAKSNPQLISKFGWVARIGGKAVIVVSVATAAYDTGRAVYEGYRAFDAWREAKEITESSVAFMRSKLWTFRATVFGQIYARYVFQGLNAPLPETREIEVLRNVAEHAKLNPDDEIGLIKILARKHFHDASKTYLDHDEAMRLGIHVDECVETYNNYLKEVYQTEEQLAKHIERIEKQNALQGIPLVPGEVK